MLPVTGDPFTGTRARLDIFCKFTCGLLTNDPHGCIKLPLSSTVRVSIKINTLLPVTDLLVLAALDIVICFHMRTYIANLVNG